MATRVARHGSWFGFWAATSLVLLGGLLAACKSDVGKPSGQGQPVGSSPANSLSPQAVANQPAPAGGRKFGAPITSTTVVPLASLAKDAAKFANQKVQTQGKVTAVCQTGGCWMEIVDGETQVHVKMYGHSFAIPRDASGHAARVEGTLLSAPGSGECEQEAEKATGRVVKLELEATGVELL